MINTMNLMLTLIVTLTIVTKINSQTTNEVRIPWQECTEKVGLFCFAAKDNASSSTCYSEPDRCDALVVGRQRTALTVEWTLYSKVVPASGPDTLANVVMFFMSTDNVTSLKSDTFEPEDILYILGRDERYTEDGEDDLNLFCPYIWTNGKRSSCQDSKTDANGYRTVAGKGTPNSLDLNSNLSYSEFQFTSAKELFWPENEATKTYKVDLARKTVYPYIVQTELTLVRNDTKDRFQIRSRTLKNFARLAEKVDVFGYLPNGDLDDNATTMSFNFTTTTESVTIDTENDSSDPDSVTDANSPDTATDDSSTTLIGRNSNMMRTLLLIGLVLIIFAAIVFFACKTKKRAPVQLPERRPGPKMAPEALPSPNVPEKPAGSGIVSKVRSDMDIGSFLAPLKPVSSVSSNISGVSMRPIERRADSSASILSARSDF
ncbi:hypothetical protein HDE_00320 [Halotydeus destructor]|nr:hypothetical protein HDE_00320 [Halotydeus destructor]